MLQIGSVRCVGARKNQFKKTTVAYSERDEEKRAAFDAQIAELPSGTPLVYVDECGVERHVVRKRLRTPRGKRVVVKRSGKREKRLNVVGGECDNVVIAPSVYEWTTKCTWFEVWFEWHLCPLLRPNS